MFLNLAVTKKGDAMKLKNHRIKIGSLALLSACALFALTGQVFAQNFPTKPIKLIIPHAPGGNSDAFGRILAQKLSERIGQQVVVENKVGAGGTIAVAFTAKSAPDGYTLVVADNGTQSIAPTLYGAKLQYDVFKDFSPITLAATFPAVILIHPSVPAKTPKEFVALVKSQPGKFTFSSAGTGNGSHLALELFRSAAGGLDMVHIPYKGGAPAMQALLAGDVQMTSVSVNTSMVHIQSGKAKAIGLAATKRSAALPDIPTFIESGIPFEAENWIAILGPAGIPAAIVNKLNLEIAAALQSPDVKERLAKLGLDVVASSPAAFSQLLITDVPKWGKAVKDSGAVAE
jgi:tripartite-type tricarboxylate transporter receptor subunit TctC